jgi:hypothetical protein
LPNLLHVKAAPREAYKMIPQRQAKVNRNGTRNAQTFTARLAQKGYILPLC